MVFMRRKSRFQVTHLTFQLCMLLRLSLMAV